MRKREYPWDWYDWQKAYFRSSLAHSSTLLLAGNQVGKSQCAAYEDALDLTGDYPEDWEGFKYEHPITLWLFGVSSEQLKDVLQKQLFGELSPDGVFQGGWVHPDEIEDFTRSRTVSGLATEVRVKHKKGGFSTCRLFSYTQLSTGKESLPVAGSVVDKIRGDEQPPDMLLGQMAVRTINGCKGKGGKRKFTLTPELGETQIIISFMKDKKPSQELIGPVSWDQAPHLTPEMQKDILADIPPHEHDMRRLGVPYFAGGLVYPISEDRIKIDPIQIPHWCKVLRAIDFGSDHPTAIAWAAYDPENDIIYITNTYRKNLRNLQTEHGQDVNPIGIHAIAANSKWRHSPLVTPHDFDQDKGTGLSLRDLYRDAGITRTIDFTNPVPNPDKTKKPPRNILVEPGIQAVYDRMTTGRFKVFSTCVEFFDEFRSYHRKDGKIVKERDDVMDAVRMASQMVAHRGVPINDNHRPVKVVGTLRG